MKLKIRWLNLYRTAGERAVRAATPEHAAWMFARRMARRQHGRSADAGVYIVGYSENGTAVHYAADLVGASGHATSARLVVRRA